MIGTKRVDTIIEGKHTYPEVGATVSIKKVYSIFLEVTIDHQCFTPDDLRMLASDLVKAATILEEDY